jgi:hypothetical protein
VKSENLAGFNTQQLLVSFQVTFFPGTWSPFFFKHLTPENIGVFQKFPDMFTLNLLSSCCWLLPSGAIFSVQVFPQKTAPF